MRNPRRRHHHSHKRTWRPYARKTIRISNLMYLITRGAVLCLLLYALIVTFKLKYMNVRVDILERGIDNFYIDDESVASIISAKKLQDKMETIGQVYKLSVDQYASVNTINHDMNQKLIKLSADMIELDLENVKLIEERDGYKQDALLLAERAELFDKYEEALYYRGHRTDITYDQLKTGIDIMEENEINPALLFGIIMVESHGIEDAQNATSSATGYGQLLTSTGKSIYEKYMGNGRGTFSSDILLDGDENIKITAAYIDYCIKHNGSIYGALNSYRGYEDADWEKALENYLKSFDTNLVEINEAIYQ